MKEPNISISIAHMVDMTVIHTHSHAHIHTLTQKFDFPVVLREANFHFCISFLW